uniref:Uncharacterized protein n=1 Tax=Ixodes ricinus TaxID=34613 RepID=A0A6B0U6J2_IXORI
MRRWRKPAPRTKSPFPTLPARIPPTEKHAGRAPARTPHHCTAVFLRRTKAVRLHHHHRSNKRPIFRTPSACQSSIVL